MKNYLSNLKNDLPASLIVFLVAVPLCLGIALASGAPLFSGIIAGIVGGIVVGSLSGSQLGVSGPAAGLAIIVLNAIQDLGAFEIFLFAVVIAGVIQFLLGVLKAGIIGYYFPNSVIKGMLAGIGVIIFIKQIPYALGMAKEAKLFSSTILENISYGPIVITALSVGILVLWEQKFMKKIPIFKIVQGPLVVVSLGILLNVLFRGSGMGLSVDQVVSIPVAKSFEGFVNLFTFPDFSQWNNPEIYKVAVVLAVVASLETLLCLEATDKLDPMKRVSPANQELRAQGIGNLVSGLIGGLPVTQVIVRSSTNIMSGGKTKVSAIAHGFILLFSAMAIPTVLNMIPLASLAAILFMVGYKLAKPSIFKSMFEKGWTNFIPFVVTIVGIVLTDLLVGIGIGMAVAIFFVLYNNYKKPFLFETDTHLGEDGEIVIQLSEDVTFLNKANIQRALNIIPDNSKVVIDASQSIDIHQDVLEIIDEFEINAQERNIEVELVERKVRPIGSSAIKSLETSLQTIKETAAVAN
ncbi:MAG: SulP family inorganic anion transporter [Saprospiraceae bacterium]|nr:SulP family inorganic anion transporter [Saprospiraceae bacterium]